MNTGHPWRFWNFLATLEPQKWPRRFSFTGVGCWEIPRNEVMIQHRCLHMMSTYARHIWSRFAVRYHPPPPPHGMVPKPAFCSIPHENVVFAVFFAWWVAGAVRKPANSFRKRVICNVLASTSWNSAAAPSSISMSNWHIILNLLLRVYSLGTRLISVYILCLSNFLLECLVFRNWSNLKFS